MVVRSGNREMEIKVVWVQKVRNQILRYQTELVVFCNGQSE